MCWTPLCANKQNNNGNKTCALLQTNGGRTEHRFYAEIVTDINVSNDQELIGIMYLTIFKLSITDEMIENLFTIFHLQSFGTSCWKCDINVSCYMTSNCYIAIEIRLDRDISLKMSI